MKRWRYWKIGAALLVPGGLLVFLVYILFFRTKDASSGALDGAFTSPNLTEAEARQHAINAGFAGDSLEIVLAIANAESGLRSNVIADNMKAGGVVVRFQGDPKPAGVSTSDRGILQINDRWHPEVSDEDAFNPAAAFVHGYRISSNGTNFRPWSTFKNGAYRRYLSTDIA